MLYKIAQDTAPKYISHLVKKNKPSANQVLRSAYKKKFVKAPKFQRQDHGG
jgi:hypothetical protein